MARTQTVTIPLEEYKELLLKDKPSEQDKALLNHILEIVSEYLDYEEESSSRYYTAYIGNSLKVHDAEKMTREIVNMLKYTDIEAYMELWNSIATAKRRKDEREAMIRQMNEAREIRAEQE